MGQKEQIVLLLKSNCPMTQSELAEAIYGDNLHTPNIYNALKSLKESGEIICSGERPARFFLPKAISVEIDAPILTLTGAAQSQSKDKKQPTAIMNEEIAIGLMLEFYHEAEKDIHGRCMSWRHCFKAFTDRRNQVDAATVDYLALQLAFYLASWGMYRPSSFLLQKDYKIHIPIVRILQEEKYHVLYCIAPEKLCQDSNLDLLMELSARVRAAYADEKPVRSGRSNHATDTLITKILLGTLGCVPAYDHFFKQAVKKYHVADGQYSRNSVRNIALFYCDHFDAFERLREKFSQCGVDYPAMKLMDLCFWQAGFRFAFKR